jgi:hypothetical protein
MAAKPAPDKMTANMDSTAKGPKPTGSPSHPISPTTAPPPGDLRLDVLMLAGVVMVVGGFALAATQRGDPAYAWAGAALLVLGGLGDRIQKVVASKDGLEVDLASRVETVNSMVKASSAAAMNTAPAATTAPAKALAGPRAAASSVGAPAVDPATLALAVTAAVAAETPAEYGQRMAELGKLLSGR